MAAVKRRTPGTEPILITSTSSVEITSSGRAIPNVANTRNIGRGERAKIREEEPWLDDPPGLSTCLATPDNNRFCTLTVGHAGPHNW